MNHTHVHTCPTRDQVKEQERGGKDLLPQVKTRMERDRLKTWLGERSFDLHAQGPGFKSTHHQIKRVGAENTWAIIFQYQKQPDMTFGNAEGKRDVYHSDAVVSNLIITHLLQKVLFLFIPPPLRTSSWSHIR